MVKYLNKVQFIIIIDAFFSPTHEMHSIYFISISGSNFSPKMYLKHSVVVLWEQLSKQANLILTFDPPI